MIIPLLLRQLLSPPHFYRLTQRLAPWLLAIALLLLIVGCVAALVFAPADYRQGDAVRIMYIHVPSAWLSLLAYAGLGLFGLIGLVYKMPVADALARAGAPLGASFAFLALVTGSLWGKPMWGSWWVWDARLTSELILFFLYVGYLALQSAIEEPVVAARAGAVLALLGLVDLPIIHFSVVWWNTLHQSASVSRLAAPAMPMEMLAPLLIMALGFFVFYVAVLFKRARAELLIMENDMRWVSDYCLKDRRC